MKPLCARREAATRVHLLHLAISLLTHNCRKGQIRGRESLEFRGLISPLSCPSKLQVGDVHFQWDLASGWVFTYVANPSFPSLETFQRCCGESAVRHGGVLAYSQEPALHLGPDHASLPKH